MCPFSQTSEWPHVNIVFQLRTLHNGGKHLTAIPNSRITNDRIGPNYILSTNHGFSVDISIGHDEGILADTYTGFDIRGDGIHHADTVQHVSAVDALTHSGFRFRQVHTGIDAYGLEQVIVYHGLNSQIILYCKLYNIGQIILPFLRIFLNTGQRRPQPFGFETVHAYIELMDVKLLGRGNGFFNNGLHLPVRTSHDPPEAARVICHNGQHTERAGVDPLRFDKTPESPVLQKGHICVYNKNIIRFALEQGRSLKGGMCCSQLRLLQDAIGGPAHKRIHLFRSMSYDHNRLLGGYFFHSFENMPKHGFSA